MSIFLRLAQLRQKVIGKWCETCGSNHLRALTDIEKMLLMTGGPQEGNVFRIECRCRCHFIEAVQKA